MSVIQLSSFLVFLQNNLTNKSIGTGNGNANRTVVKVRHLELLHLYVIQFLIRLEVEEGVVLMAITEFTNNVHNIV